MKQFKDWKQFPPWRELWSSACLSCQKGLSKAELITVYMHLCEGEIHGTEELFNLGEKGVNERMARIQTHIFKVKVGSSV